MNSGKVLLGLLAGIAVGAIAGILLAPESGATTRNNISRKSNAYAEKLGNQFKGFIEGITEKFEAMTEEAADMAENSAANMRSHTDGMSSHKKV